MPNSWRSVTVGLGVWRESFVIILIPKRIIYPSEKSPQKNRSRVEELVSRMEEDWAVRGYFSGDRMTPLETQKQPPLVST
jgi:hypothetical protein